MLVFWLGCLGLALWSILTLWLVREDYQNRRRLSSLSVITVWILYLLHFGIELYAAWKRYWSFERSAFLLALGALLLLVGTAVYVLGILHLRSVRRMSGVDTSQLVQDGIYRWSRNPQNLGWELVLLGIGLISGSFLALSLAFMFWVIFASYVPMEERYLASIYGDQYRRYESSSHRYFGLPGNRTSELC